MNRWAEFHTAYQVAKLGTVSAAAETLGIHRATVNRHIDLLEAELGARIFLRHARGYSLTDLGSEFLQVAQKTEALVDDLAGRAQSNRAQLEGDITLSVMPMFTKAVFAPVKRFREENPGCKVNILATESLSRLEYGEAHVAIRARGKPENPDYVVRPYRSIALNLYAHQSYIDRKGLPSGSNDMAGHHFVWLANDTIRPPFASWVEKYLDPSQMTVTTSNLTVKFDAIEAGVGLGFMSELDAASHADLHRVLPDNPTWRVPLWLVTHVDLHRTSKVQRMLACLEKA
ncbi:LysR family transcriptional regulator [Denitrobaculum tricleocarpae]|uniref:LysR family transcriptional regulator n=1 Tax=Denitrobaculum tricleocarpae TaxID=2591009 RepID=A0A545TKY8_9PROT|nr:LysR family transcriptional regulator [Denitrobaculum tricleocarpae]TQV77900.1 LysR family transcriptional regulator [Denitrobaculum tricleocarpae]